MTYTHEGQEYEVIAVLGHFELQGLKRTLTIPFGYDRLRRSCEKELREEVNSAEYINYDYDFESDLDDMVDENTIDYIKSNISRAVVTEHNLN